MIAGHQNFGNIAALPAGGFGVLRMLKQAVGMAFLDRTFGVAKNAGQQAHGGVQHGLGGDLSACHHEIAKGYFCHAELFQNPLIHPFKAATQHRHPITARQILRHRLIKAPPARRHIKDRPAPTGVRLRLRQSRANDIGAQHHASTATCGRVIHIAMPPDAVGTQIMGVQLPFAVLQRLAGQGRTQHTGKCLGEQRDDARLPDANEIGRFIHQRCWFQRGPDCLAAVGFLWCAHAHVLLQGGCAWNRYLKPNRNPEEQSLNIKTEAMRAARAVWLRLAESSGLVAGNFVLSLLSARREGAGGGRVVVLAEGGARYVIKFRLNGRTEQFETALQAHHAAWQSMAAVPDCAAPLVLATDAQAGALLLEWVSAPTLLQALTRDPTATARAMNHTGRWMAAMHRGGAHDTVAFKADWMLGRLDVKTAGGVAEPAEYAACRTALNHLAKEARGAQMKKAVIHGDLTLSNLMWDGHVMTGIDFENTGIHPIVRDAAMLLCDVAVRCPVEQDSGLDGLLSADIMKAFARGLGEDAAPSPLLRFFIAYQMLHRWSRMPLHPGDWSMRRALAFSRVKSGTQRVLQDVL